MKACVFELDDFQTDEIRLSDLCQVRHNATDHGDWRDYYNTATFELIRQREKLISEHHDY